MPLACMCSCVEATTGAHARRSDAYRALRGARCCGWLSGVCEPGHLGTALLLCRVCRWEGVQVGGCAGGDTCNWEGMQVGGCAGGGFCGVGILAPTSTGLVPGARDMY